MSAVDGPGAPDSTCVLIVGAGPVGLTLAIELARRDIPVRIIDRLPEATPQSRAIAVHSRTLDHFSALGVIDQVLARSIRTTGMEMHSDGKTVATVDFQHIHATHPYSVSLPQSDTEAVLADRVAELGVNVERDTEFLGYQDESDHVVARVSTAGEESFIRADYLIGADGAASVVRHAMGQELNGSFVGDDVILGDIDGIHDYARSHFHGFFSPGKTTGLLFPLAGDRVRVFAQLPAGTDPDREVTTDWLQQLLAERSIEIDVTAAHWLTRFTLKHGQVARYREGRVFLAGDAAHIHSPAGALGMNTGIQDAMNLGWKLARVIHEVDVDQLLDSYHDERHPIGAHVVSMTTELTNVATVSNPVAQRIRNALMHLGVEVPALVDKMAEIVEQQTVRYRRSPIVAGRGGSLHPGDFLYLPDADLGAALADSTEGLTLVVGESSVSTEGSSVELSAESQRSVRRDGRLSEGDIIVLRPDGYIGFIGPRSEFTTH